jgi:hypothetical protein
VTNDPRVVRCGTHGKRIAAVVCGHLVEAQDRIVGFVENVSDPMNLQAWCEDCERVFLAEGGMTPAFLEFNRMSIVCNTCYVTYRARHSR